MNKTLKLFVITIYAAGILGITGCEDHQERYQIPPWLGGSSIETLEETGNYTVFLDLMKKANYTEPVSKQLFTLFVPDDNAFDAYFKSIGKNSVDDLTKDEAVNLFTLHVLRNPRSRLQLIYEFAWNEFQGPTGGQMGEYASLFHRKETPSTSTPYNETIRYLPGREGEELLIYTGSKNVPLFTEEFFSDYGAADDGSDYLAMYPGSTWKKDYAPNLKGMNWHNAMVIPNPYLPEGLEPELEVRTANGFIYYLDRVVGYMPSIEEYMIANPDKYGLYYDILQRFARYHEQKTDEQSRVLWRKGYDLIYDLAEERARSTNTAVPPQYMWTAFLPTNDVLQQYLDNTVLKYYSDLDSVPRVTLYYILQNQLSSTMTVMSKMEKQYFNAFGDPTEMSRENLGNGFMASNGIIYESKKILEPNVFTCVPGLLFIDKNYTTLLFALSEANMLSSLANADADVTLFATNNEGLEEYGIRYNSTSAKIEFRGPLDGKWSTMRSIDLIEFAQDQIFRGSLSDFGGDGGFVELSSKNFLHYFNNKVGGPENQSFENWAKVEEVVENERNGYLIKVDRPVESRWVMGQYLTADEEVSDFSELLVDAGMLNLRVKDAITKEIIPSLKFLAAADYWTAFIPTNDALQKARDEGLLPQRTSSSWYRQLSTAGKDSVDAFISYHFVPKDVIFDDGAKSGYFNTQSTYLDEDGATVLNYQLKITNEANNLTITDISGKDVTVDKANANILVKKGVCHKINAAFKYYE